MKKTNIKTVTLATALMLLLSLPFAAFAQYEENRGLFGRGGSSADYDYSGGESLMRQGEPNTYGTITNDSFGAPLGSGVAILLAAGAGYAVVRRKRTRKNTMLLLACVALLGFTQCKKEEPLEPNNDGNTTRITLNVDNGDNKGSRVNVSGADVAFASGDKILVVYDGKYVGTITHNGTNFTGDIALTQSGDQPLYFYFLGNKDAGTLAAGETASCTVDVSDQTSELPVISMAPSEETFPSEGNTYTARLHNKCSLMKFNVTTLSDAPICIAGMNNKVMVDFSKAANKVNNNGFTYDKEGAGVIKMSGGGSGEKWAIVLPQNALSEAEDAVYSADGYYSGNRPAMAAISANQYLNSGVSLTVSNKSESYTTPLTFEAKKANSQIRLTIGASVTPTPSIEYNVYDGNGWQSYASDTYITLSQIGDEVSFRGANTTMAIGTGSSDYSKFSANYYGEFYVYGNVMSLLSKDNFAEASSVPEYAFFNLFSSFSSLYNHESKAIILPATTLAKNCYRYMFGSCSNLTTAPALPATTLVNNCYENMFNGCTGLTQAPELPATTVADYCYSNMFKGCTGLTTAPTLSTTTLDDYCYYHMFDGCTKLTSAPELSATTLADHCCSYMFNNCTSLTAAPSLAATTLVNNCYEYMFTGCAKLTSTPALPASTLADSCYYHMFEGCKGLTSTPELPATTLANYCYSNMFKGCTGLTKAPELPATTLAKYCYSNMFEGCTELTSTPELPATTLSDGCYFWMFKGCTNLTTAPALPATTLANSCYSNMFQGCMGLTSAPELKATTLASFCYYYMFSGCTGLTSAPVLPATTLVSRCYQSMFEDCTGLTSAPELPATTLADYCYSSMFSGCTGLTSAPELPVKTLARSCYSRMFFNCSNLASPPALPATTLADYCYNSMLSGCHAMTTAPELPATTLADHCYASMFSSCDGITVAPALPATTLANYCYYQMFYYCDANLTTAPALPATTLAEHCYDQMFYHCDKLTTVPNLPATTLTDYCYNRMFQYCSSLTTAPTLPAPTLTDHCYYQMFQYCSKLKSVTCLATNISASDCTTSWLSGTATIGYRTFTKAASMTGWTTGSYSGIPSNWNIVNYSGK